MLGRVRRTLVALIALGAGLGTGLGAATLAGALGAGDDAACALTATTTDATCTATTDTTTTQTTPTDTETVPVTTPTTTETTTPAPPPPPTTTATETTPAPPPAPTTTTAAATTPAPPPAPTTSSETATTLAPPPPAPVAAAASAPVTAAAAAPAVALAHVAPAAAARPGPRLQDRRPYPHAPLPSGVRLPAPAVAHAMAAASTIDVAAFGPLQPPAFGPGAATSIPFPTWLLAVYEAAAAQYGIPWPVLASINEIETDYGHDAGTSSAGAVGWMQFMPSTWARYGVDADGDGVADPAHPVDAIFSAARYLRAAGGRTDLARAIFAYNHAGWYVQRVLERAKVIGGLRADLAASLAADGAQRGRHLLAPGAPVDSLGRAMLLDDAALRRHVLADAHIDIYPCGREDIALGDVDRRVLLTLVALRDAGMDPAVSSLHCGHGVYTTSGNVSEHTSGSAVDIAAINGVPILGHQGQGSITDDAIRVLLGLQDVLGAHQIISLMTYPGRAETLALPDHADHIHVGFHPLRPLLEDPRRA